MPQNPADERGLADLSKILLATALAIVAAMLAMIAAYCWPQSDPVDVVGLSLIRGFDGYTEQAEKSALHALVAASLLAGPLLFWMLRPLSAAFASRLGLALAWGILLYAFRDDLALVVSFCVCSASLVLLGGFAPRLGLDREAVQIPAWASAVVIWGAAYHPPRYFGWIVLCALGLLLLLRLRRPALLVKLVPPLSVVTAAILLVVSGQDDGFRRVVLLALTFLFVNADTALRAVKRFFDPLVMLLAAAAIFWGGRPFWGVSLHEQVCLALESLACGVLLEMGHLRERVFADRTGFRGLLSARVMAWMLPVAIFLLVPGWLGGCLAVLLAAIAWGEIRGLALSKVRPTGRIGLLLAAAFLLSCWPARVYVPELSRKSLDTFHVGQVLSAIWELEQGRPVYAEVFPLRSADVYVGWLSRRLLGPTRFAADVPLMFGSALIGVGALLIGFAWTRSPEWSLLCGLLLYQAVNIPTGSGRGGGLREGLLLISMGLSVEILRSPVRPRWLLLIPLGIVPFLSGYDIAVPWLAGIGIALAIGAAAKLNRRGIVTGLAWSFGVAGLTAALFSAGIAAIAGARAALDYWTILFDYARHYTAFYGLPVETRWYDDQRLSSSLIVLTAFAAGGAILWPRLRAARRRQWAFLVVVTTLFLYRGVGRSSDWHIESATVPLRVFWPLLVFTCLRELSRRNLWMTANSLRLAAQGGLLLLAFNEPGRPASLPEFVRSLRKIPAEEALLYAPDPAIAKLIPPGQFFWPVEQGIANIEQQRSNPTRHAIAFCIGSPAEQRRAVQDLKSHPTPVILWDWGSFDSIPGTLRYWMISTWVLRNYRPVDALLDPYPYPYAIPAGSQWPGLEIVPRPFAVPFEMRRLPEVWGERRWPQHEPHVAAAHILPPWEPAENRDASTPDQSPSAFVVTENIIPRQWNYATLVLAATAPAGNEAIWPTVVLELGDGKTFDDRSRLTWEIRPDGKPHRFLIPIGSQPGWTWRSQVRQLRMSIDRGRLESPAPLTLLEINELDPEGS